MDVQTEVTREELDRRSVTGKRDWKWSQKREGSRVYIHPDLERCEEGAVGSHCGHKTALSSRTVGYYVSLLVAIN